MEEIQTYIEQLLQIPLFQSLTAEGLKRVLALFKVEFKRYSKGEFIWTAGSKIEKFGVLLSGKLEIFTESIDGRKILIHEVAPNRSFGDVIVWSQASCSPVTVASMQDSIVALFNCHKIEYMQDSDGELLRFMRNILTHISKQALFLSSKIDYLSSKSLRDKLMLYLENERFRQKSDQIRLPFSKTALATFLGVDRSAMSRELTKMKTDGIIDFSKDTISIL